MNKALPQTVTAQAAAWENPMGTDGFEFIEYAAPDPKAMGELFERMGFKPIARHRHKDVVLYRQGGINFIVNREPKSLAWYFAAEHGASACGLGFRVRDAHKAYARALELGAQPIEIPTGPMELRLPAIKGIGGAPLYLIDRFEDGKSIYDIDFVPIPGADEARSSVGLTYLDHLTHNLHRGLIQYPVAGGFQDAHFVHRPVGADRHHHAQAAVDLVAARFCRVVQVAHGFDLLAPGAPHGEDALVRARGEVRQRLPRPHQVEVVIGHDPGDLQHLVEHV